MDAIACMMKTRSPPPIYNPDRLFENPIPKINVQAMRPSLVGTKPPAARTRAQINAMHKRSTDESFGTCKLYLDLVREKNVFSSFKT